VRTAAKRVTVTVAEWRYFDGEVGYCHASVFSSSDDDVGDDGDDMKSTGGDNEPNERTRGCQTQGGGGGGGSDDDSGGAASGKRMLCERCGRAGANARSAGKKGGAGDDGCATGA